jgi:Flp pilus assembly protein TadD
MPFVIAKAPSLCGRRPYCLPVTHRLIGPSVAVALSMAVCACTGPEAGNAPATLTVEDPSDTKYFASDEPYRLGVENFDRGHYGLAERYFRDAVEKAPEDASGWVALASSYDRLRRFDLADAAYRRASDLAGETVQILNNQSYSLMLRGKLDAARAKFLRAAKLDPTNVTILNNIRLLDQGSRYMRSAG